MPAKKAAKAMRPGAAANPKAAEFPAVFRRLKAAAA